MCCTSVHLLAWWCVGHTLSSVWLLSLVSAVIVFRFPISSLTSPCNLIQSLLVNAFFCKFGIFMKVKGLVVILACVVWFYIKRVLYDRFWVINNNLVIFENLAIFHYGQILNIFSTLLVLDGQCYHQVQSLGLMLLLMHAVVVILPWQ